MSDPMIQAWIQYTHLYGWKFTERVYEVRYHDTTPPAGSAPPPPAAPVSPPAGNKPPAEATR